MMRAHEFLNESIGQSVEVIAYHCSNEKFDQFRLAENRGIYFANEPDHEYGKYIYRCRVRLRNAYYADSLDNFEIDRGDLIIQGYDGRVVDYTEENDGEMFDYIAFYPNQIKILDVTERSA